MDIRKQLADGELALQRSAEVLGQGKARLSRWETITPTGLRPAVEHIRSSFEESHFLTHLKVERACYAALHPSDASAIEEILTPERRIAFKAMCSRTSLPALFLHFCNEYTKELENIVEIAFQELLRVGMAQEPLLMKSLPPIKWAETHVSYLLDDVKRQVPGMLKRMCDKQDYSQAATRSLSTQDGMDAFKRELHWLDWRAPQLIHMKPSGNTFYDAANLWTREDEDNTNQLLKGFTVKVADPGTYKLDKLVGKAHVDYAAANPPKPHVTVPEYTFEESVTRYAPSVPAEHAARYVTKAPPPASEVSRRDEIRPPVPAPLAKPNLEETLLLAALEKSKSLLRDHKLRTHPAEIADAAVILGQFFELSVTQNTLRLELFRATTEADKNRIKAELKEIEDAAEKWNAAKEEARQKIHRALEQTEGKHLATPLAAAAPTTQDIKAAIRAIGAKHPKWAEHGSEIDFDLVCAEMDKSKTPVPVDWSSVGWARNLEKSRTKVKQYIRSVIKG
jgi:hypothetical protein